jgi:hypothetical protein
VTTEAIKAGKTKLTSNENRLARELVDILENSRPGDPWTSTADLAARLGRTPGQTARTARSLVEKGHAFSRAREDGLYFQATDEAFRLFPVRVWTMTGGTWAADCVEGITNVGQTAAEQLVAEAIDHGQREFSTRTSVIGEPKMPSSRQPWRITTALPASGKTRSFKLEKMRSYI